MKQINVNSLNNLNYNYTPLSEEEVRRRFKEKGYDIIDFRYINNISRMPCYDSEGYIVMVSESSLSKNIKQYTRFSTVCNLENFEYNVKLFIKKNNLTCEYLDWRKSQTKNHIDILIRCECGNEFWCDFNWWKRSLKQRCNDCNSKISNIELKVKDFLDENNIKYIQQYTFDDCKFKRKLRFDFYLIDYNSCIEVDGIQHYYSQSVRYFKNGVYNYKDFEEIKNRDEIKNKYCKDNNIKLLRIKYNRIENSDKYKEIILNFLK